MTTRRNPTIFWLMICGFLIANATDSLPAVPQTNPALVLFLHGSGPLANPPVLFFDGTAPSSTTVRYRDSAGLKFAGGNLWKDVGVWSAQPSMVSGSLIDLGDARFWLGLKNSDDQGTRFDLRVEIYKAEHLISAGETYCIQGVTRNPSLAKEVVLPLPLSNPVWFNGSTEDLSLRILTRIGTNGAGAFCGGHSNAVGLRLYFDSEDRAAQLSLTFEQATNFKPTGNMTIGRVGHRATLLNNGRVLITGGGGSDILASADLYNPETGTFTATNSMASPRLEHTATLLKDGKVLITGGYGSFDELGAPVAVASAELYDPTTGTFMARTSMTSRPEYHTATLLNNEMVLIAGGKGGSANAELYDPVTETFIATGSMASPCWFHTATLLNNGMVLIAGGNDGSDWLARAELYDPATATFTPIGSMARSREGHTATLLNNGEVLIAGGIGGGASAELYTPTELTPP